ncbi:hypothetical protein GOP47_0006273 [Adiantum capillus-veneris]|uniref:Uncharacterized protein n=1 Tax=Adiantum capillus-veneris TaxID=13818 RepID=A0A9D4V3D9_ADICA|nr:hypothetical protein GOP47_0006273 [Adiantum capillus-veneris]
MGMEEGKSKVTTTTTVAAAGTGGPAFGAGFFDKPVPPELKQLRDLFREDPSEAAQATFHINSQICHNLREIKVERCYEGLGEDFSNFGQNGAHPSNEDRGHSLYEDGEHPFIGAIGRLNSNNNSCMHIQGSMSTSGSLARVLPVMYSPTNTCNLQPQQLHRAQCEGYQEDQHQPQRSYSGRSSTTTLTGAGYALEGLRFISRSTCCRTDQKLQWWEAVERRFHKLASADGSLSRSNFAACIGMEDSEAFAGELFDALTRRKGEDDVSCISLEGLKDYWYQITDESFHSRAQIFFNLCDKDSDGRIAEEEVKEMIMLSASSNKLSILEEQAEEYASLIMQELDVDKQGYIELSHLESLFRAAAQGLSRDNSMIRSNNAINSKISLAPTPLRRRRRVLKSLLYLNRKAMYFLWDHWQRIWVLASWVATMVGLFTWKFIQYKNRADFQVMGYCVCTAKGAAETLKLNMALILLPVCRNSMTWLRSTLLGSIMPFNDNINFHKIIAGGILLGVTMHAGSHLGCDFPRIAAADQKMFMATIASDFGNKQPSVMEIVLTLEVMSGIIMVVLMGFAYLLANHWFRRNIVKLPWPFHRLTGFNAFWYSHHLFLLVYAILIIHSLYLFLAHDWTQKTTWIYVAAPMLLYMGERSLRVFRARQYKVNTVKAAIYHGDVLALYMTKPPGFKYESGMYIFLQCPAISPFEWHPFSITSAPGDQYLSVHIRALGDWTREMGKVFREALDYSERKKYEIDENEHDPRFPKLCIDGPYGAPAQDYKKYEVLLLVGVGIGATPFISVVKDVLNHIRLAELNLVDYSSNSISSSKSSESPTVHGQNNNYASPVPLMSMASPRRPKKKHRPPTQAYFYWITREQGSFDWFKGIMNEVAETDHRAVIEMHNYLTSVYEEGDARSALITLVQALHHARSGVDILSGTRVRTHFARPNWRKVFSRIAESHPGARIGVFYCGPSVLAKELERLSSRFSQNSSSKFEFHKENF